MWQNTLGKEIQRTNRNLLISALILVGGVAGVSTIAQRYLRNALLGPRSIMPDEIATIRDADDVSRYYVTLPSAGFEDTGLQEVETTTEKYSNRVKSERVTARFMALRVGDRVVVAKAPENELGASFTGELMRVPSDVSSQFQGVPLADTMVDATGGFATGAWIGGAIGLLIFAIGARNFLKYTERSNDVAKHPVALALAPFGEPAEVADAIEKELGLPGVIRLGGAILTPGWILRPFLFHVEIRRVEDLVWIYKKVTTHKKYGVTTGTTFEAVIRDRAGGTIVTSGAEADMNRLLGEIMARAPWVIPGYDAAVESQWNRARATLVAAVDERRKAIEKEAASPKEAPAMPAAPAANPLLAPPKPAAGISRDNPLRKGKA